jgi:hypothetical protein
LQKFVPRVASAIVTSPWSSLRTFRMRWASSPLMRSTEPAQSGPNHHAWIEVLGNPNANTDRIPASRRPWTAASAWSGVFMMCDQSTSVVMPAFAHSIAPHRFAASTSSAR